MAESAGGSESELATQLANLFQQNVNQQNSNPKLSDHLQINLKLNSQNYALWTRMIRVAIGGKSKTLLKHLTETQPSKSPTDKYEVWEQEDLVVFSWLIQNIEPNIAGNLTEYPTAKALWDALAITYSSGRDKLQTFNLHVKANELKQNHKSLEDFWIELQGTWGEIDRIDPNPMKCTEDIQTYTRIRSEQKLFQFLNGLDQKFEPIKREILRVDPLPTAETAYSTVRKEAAHQTILGATNNESHGIATGLIAGEADGVGLATKGYRRFDYKKKVDKSHLKCEACGMSKHTKDQCFEIIGYPDWWTDDHRTARKGGSKKAETTNTSSHTNRRLQDGGGTPAAAGFGGVAAAAGEGEEGGENFMVSGGENGYQDGTDYWAWY